MIRRLCSVRNEEFIVAPLPAQPIDKGMVGSGLLARLLIDQFTPVAWAKARRESAR